MKLSKNKLLSFVLNTFLDLLFLVVLVFSIVCAVLSLTTHFSFFGVRLGVVNSASMEASNIEIGDIVYIKGQNSYQIGDIIAFYRMPGLYDDPDVDVRLLKDNEQLSAAQKYAQTKDLAAAVREAAKEIEGAYALCVMHNDCKQTLVITKRNAPLLVGIGENEFFAASDVPAIIKHTKKAVYLSDNQIAVLTPEKMVLTDANGQEIKPKIEVLPWEPVALSKMGYKHYRK